MNSCKDNQAQMQHPVYEYFLHIVFESNEMNLSIGTDLDL